MGVTRQWCRAGLVAVLLLGGCSTDGPAPRPSPSPETSTPSGTVERSDVGDRLTLTAVVERVLGPRSFVVRDADLADVGVLVLTTRPVEVAVPDVVVVAGTVTVFRYARSGGDRLGDQRAFRQYEGRKALLAQTVRPLSGPGR
jgi:hypothetical protein